MATNPWVREIDNLTTSLDGLKVTVGVDYSSVTITGGSLGFRLTGVELEHFARALISAAWQAGVQESDFAATVETRDGVQ